MPGRHSALVASTRFGDSRRAEEEAWHGPTAASAAADGTGGGVETPEIGAIVSSGGGGGRSGIRRAMHGGEEGTREGEGAGDWYAPTEPTHQHSQIDYRQSQSQAGGFDTLLFSSTPWTSTGQPQLSHLRTVSSLLDPAVVNNPSTSSSTGIGGDFTFASAFDSPSSALAVSGDYETYSPYEPEQVIDPISISPISPISPFEAQTEGRGYFAPFPASAPGEGVFAGGGGYRLSEPIPLAHAGTQGARSALGVQVPPPLMASSSFGSFSRGSAGQACHQPTAEPSSLYQPFAFSSSAPTASSACPPGYSSSLFPSSTQPSFPTLAAPSAPIEPQSSEMARYPSFGTFSSSAGRQQDFFPSPPLSAAPLVDYLGYRRHSAAPAFPSHPPYRGAFASTSVVPPSPPSSRSSLLAGAFLPEPSPPGPAVASPAVAAAYGVGNTATQARFAGAPSPSSPLATSSFPPFSASSAGFLPSPPSAPLTSPRTSAHGTSAAGKAPKSRRRGSSSAKSRSPGEGGGEDDEEYQEKMRNRPISPITGKPTKIIAKRGWPPKDAHKRVYLCEVEGCGKSFGRPSARDTHARSHSGVKPFVCPIPSCARAFTVFSNLKRHLGIHPTVDFRQVSVHDLPLIRWVDDPNEPEGGRLEWIDEALPGGAPGALSTSDESMSPDFDGAGDRDG
ncbi:hypothetical protein JCM11641_003265 [Rhodosporidiobolus odoratus]